MVMVVVAFGEDDGAKSRPNVGGQDAERQSKGGELFAEVAEGMVAEFEVDCGTRCLVVEAQWHMLGSTCQACIVNLGHS